MVLTSASILCPLPITAARAKYTILPHLHAHVILLRPDMISTSASIFCPPPITAARAKYTILLHLHTHTHIFLFRQQAPLPQPPIL
jgi:hypothetical protein